MGRVRLSGGLYGGRYVVVPDGIRPTEGRVREALLSMWQPRLAGARLLELFAGSGAVAIEALGRGVGEAVLVEGDPRVAAALRRNLEEIVGAVGWRILPRELPAAFAGLVDEPPFDLVFADPPYERIAYDQLVAAAASLIARGGELVVEHPSSHPWTDAAGIELERVAERTYGGTTLTRYRR